MNFRLTSSDQKPMVNHEMNHGFTLLELLIALVVVSIVGICTFTSYSVQSKSFTVQREISKVQQDMRGALYLMEFDLLNAGRDPWMSNTYGLTDVRFYDYDPTSLDNLLAAPNNVWVPGAHIYLDSFPVLEFSSLRFDSDGDGVVDQPLTIRYQVYDFENNGRLDLARRAATGDPLVWNSLDLVAQGVVAVGYAFAYNPKPAGQYHVQRTPALNSVIWAADTDGDNLLDANIDGSGDGEITDIDDTNGDGVIDAGDLNTALPEGTVPLDQVVAAKIWIMMQSERESPDNRFDGTPFYAVGNRIFYGPFDDGFKRRVQTVTIALRNYRKS